MTGGCRILSAWAGYVTDMGVFDVLQSHDNVIYNILLFLKETNEPAGAGSVQRFLEKKGFSMAEATVGRVLRDMDCAGYTEKRSNQGRAISADGEKRLRELEEMRWHDKWTEGFLDVFERTDKNYLLDLLEARLPVETTVARLAARRASACSSADFMPSAPSSFSSMRGQTTKPCRPSCASFSMKPLSLAR